MKTLFAGIFLMASAALAQGPVTCSTATLTGTHSLVLNGRDVLPSAAITKAYLSVGTATFDGSGNFTMTLSANTAGAAAGSRNWSGTYTLPSNCLGTMTVINGNLALFTLIPFNNGNSFTITGGDATFTYTGTGSPEPAACVAASFSGAYTFTGNGYSLATGAINGVNTISGLLQFDGVSAVTANWTVSSGTTSAANTLTGSYTLNASCTATATLTDSGGVVYILNMAMTAANAADFGMTIASPTALISGNGHSTFTNPGLAVELAAGAGLPVPPGNLFSIYGSGMSTGTGQLTGFPMPFNIAQASVTVNGEAVPLYFVSSSLINAQMPLDIAPGLATLVVKNGNTPSNAVAINISATAVPAVFIYNTNHAAAQNLPLYSLNSDSNPAAVGDEIVVYFTGGGPVQGQASLLTGHATPAAQFPVTEPYTVTIAGVQATVDYVGLVPTAVGGFYQANVFVPKVAAGDRNLVITINGKASAATTVSVK
jgi:uncharacterized protein (TIGR03437 family)